jgi:hypothetical protein
MVEQDHPDNVPCLGRPLSRFEAWILRKVYSTWDLRWKVPCDRTFRGMALDVLCHDLLRCQLIRRTARFEMCCVTGENKFTDYYVGTPWGQHNRAYEHAVAYK